MNLFVLDPDPVIAAQLQCNKHVVKMIVESAQMLSTAHRMLDGYCEKRPSKSGKRTSNYWVHPNEFMERELYRAVHHHHPCTVWTTKSSANYHWHYKHFIALCNEFEYRYDKKHATDLKLRNILKQLPTNIPQGNLTQMPLAMQSNPECMFPNDPVKSYRAFYQTKQERFKMEWKRRPIPEWFEVRV